MVGLLGRVINPSQGLYLHRTTQHRKTRTNIHALSGIRTHDPSNQPAKIHASDRTATVTGILFSIQKDIKKMCCNDVLWPEMSVCFFGAELVVLPVGYLVCESSCTVKLSRYTP
jgi:hypothetical protein